MKLIFALTGSIKGEQGEGEVWRRGTGRRERERKRGGGRFFGFTLKLTVEFRFLYNRFNLIPALDRSGEDVSGERISISEVSNPLSEVTALTRYLPFTLSYTLLPPPRDPSPSLLLLPLLVSSIISLCTAPCA